MAGKTSATIEIDTLPLKERVEQFVARELGAGARLAGFEIMPDGHAGLTFGMDVQDAKGASSRYILKMAPAGVPLSGSTDIYRQSPLLRALHQAGLPVPKLVWSSADPAILGAPFIIMERLPGRTFLIWQPHASFFEAPEHIPGLWLQAASTMGALHSHDWEKSLPTWETPVSLAGELERWASLLKHTQDPQWSRLAHALYEKLKQSMPDEGPIGLVHGDFQPGNILYHEGQMTGVIDWDLASIGPLGIDCGWLMLMADRDCWEGGWKPEGPPSRGDLWNAYVSAGGTATANLGWFQAFAHFRVGSIAGLNLKLHRDGRRVDDIWEKFAPSIARLLAFGPDVIERQEF